MSSLSRPAASAAETEVPTLSVAHPRRDAAVARLMQRINYERLPAPPYGERYLKLDRMRSLLRRLGHPETALPIVHIAGTKGKGSTSAMVAAILHAGGYDVGVYSSPHLESIEERFAINGRPCTPTELADLVERIWPVVQQMDAESLAANDSSLRPTFFELCTALALVHFAARRVDCVVLEVGLGGRLDSTNVCLPVVTAVTSISLDHVRQLGDTLEKIAFEKGGIIKPGVPVVIGPMAEGPRRVLVELAQQRGSPTIETPRDFRFAYRPPHRGAAQGSPGRFDFDSDAATPLTDVALGMLGRCQAANAAIAAATVGELQRQGWRLDPAAFQRGLAAARLPGRVEVVSFRPTVLLDVAHNVASVEALVDCLRENFAPCRRTLVFSASKDKDFSGMLAVLLPLFDRVVLTEFQDNPRAVPAAQLAAQCQRADLEVLVQSDPRQAWRLAAMACAPEELICITGSFFLVAELRALVASSRLPDNSPAPSPCDGRAGEGDSGAARPRE